MVFSWRLESKKYMSLKGKQKLSQKLSANLILSKVFERLTYNSIGNWFMQNKLLNASLVSYRAIHVCHKYCKLPM